MKRTIVFGDVHGCIRELEDLVGLARPAAGDMLVSVGDIIGKGPESRAVLDWAIATPNLMGVLGNHELRFLESWRRGETPREKSYDEDTVRQLGPRFDLYMRWLERWPLTLEDKSKVIVHAGFDPRMPLAGQDPRILCNIRRLEDGTPWYEQYTLSRLVVFGHWVRRSVLLRDNAIGLDTGCVYGGRLSALILPELRVISVPARRAYVGREAWA